MHLKTLILYVTTTWSTPPSKDLCSETIKNCFLFCYGSNFVLGYCQDLVGILTNDLPCLRRGSRISLVKVVLGMYCWQKLGWVVPSFPPQQYLELVSTLGFDLIILAPWGVSCGLSWMPNLPSLSLTDIKVSSDCLIRVSSGLSSVCLLHYQLLCGQKLVWSGCRTSV